MRRNPHFPKRYAVALKLFHLQAVMKKCPALATEGRRPSPPPGTLPGILAIHVHGKDRYPTGGKPGFSL